MKDYREIIFGKSYIPTGHKPIPTGHGDNGGAQATKVIRTKTYLDYKCDNGKSNLNEPQESKKAMAFYDFPVRMERIVHLLLKNDPEIITLEEVDCYEGILKILDRHGYDGCIQHKALTSPSVKWGGLPDGVAVFWKMARFTKEKHEGGTFLTPKWNGKTGKLEGTPKESSQPYIMVDLLDTEADNKRITVFAGHFKSGTSKDTKAKAIKMYQSKAMCGKIREAQERGRVVIFGSDFNCDNKDAAFERFYAGEKTDTFEGGIQDILDSAYPLGLRDELSATEDGQKAWTEHDPDTNPSTWKWRMGGEQVAKIIDKLEDDAPHTIDFIFFDKKVFESIGVLSTPKEEEIKAATGGLALPSPQYPSDHLLIMTELRYRTGN